MGDPELRATILEVTQGRADDLGGGVFKNRLSDNMHRSIVLAKGGRTGCLRISLPSRIGPISTPTSSLISRSSPRPTVA